MSIEAPSLLDRLLAVAIVLLSAVGYLLCLLVRAVPHRPGDSLAQDLRDIRDDLVIAWEQGGITV